MANDSVNPRYLGQNGTDRSWCQKQGSLVIFFNNFLALVIKANVADADSDGATAYSVGLIIVNIFFFLSIWGNTLATMKETFSRSHVQVCPTAMLESDTPPRATCMLWISYRPQVNDFDTPSEISR